MISQIADDRNLIVIRTFSKIYGMAGARIGYILSSPEIIGYLGITATGFCCNRVGLLGAEAALEADLKGVSGKSISAPCRKNKSGLLKWITLWKP